MQHSMSDVFARVEGRLKVLLAKAGVADSARVASAVVRGDKDAELPADPVLALLSFDPVAIQELVLASPRPITIRGASASLAKWDRDLYDGEVLSEPWSPLFAGGGQAVLLGLACDADSAAKQLQNEFQTRFLGPCGAAVLRVSPRSLVRGPDAVSLDLNDRATFGLGVTPAGGGGFGALLGALALSLRAKKDGQAIWSVPGHTEARCAECGVRPGRRPSPRRDETRLCDRCSMFRNKGTDHPGARSFDEFEGGVAFLAIDGAGIGSQLQALSSLGAYISLSSSLLAAFSNEAVREIMKELGVDEGGYQIIVAGGDDILIAFDARTSAPGVQGPVDLGVRVLSAVESRVREALSTSWPSDLEVVPTIGAGAGVLVARNLSASVGFALAQDLVRSAKTRRAGNVASALDFEYLSSSSIVATTLEGVRQGRTRSWDPVILSGCRDNRTAEFRYHRRPFSIAEARDLLDAAERADDGVRSRIYRVRSALDEDPMVGVVTGAYLLRDRLEFALPAEALCGDLR